MALISFVIPALNAESTLRETMESLVNQTFKDFDVYIINDGSRDRTGEVILEFADRIQLTEIRHDVSMGVAASINDGLKASDSEFVARLDADDIALPQRLEEQIALLRAHLEIDVCGSHCEFFDGGTHQSMGLLCNPESHLAIRTSMMQKNAIAHPSVLVRRSFFEHVGLYDSAMDYAEDYDLWCRGIALGRRFYNIQRPLTRYRLHPNQVSRMHSKPQLERDILVKRRYMQNLLGGRDPLWLPYFLSQSVTFGNPKQAAQALAESSAVLTLLLSSDLDKDAFTVILQNAINKHLTNLL
ncbi:hypothetical protein RB25_09735 [Herbaspirillum rubrisubalbicans]|uniref:Glycosyltransferase 2-like domain-containing protein n=1 Tax=Herbaspirillum rubrisubalbicans TaxID=80842 RepID=A0ABX9C0K6_9BURK|nr:glycosyltransferase [Herbaspirillum rubrisubalbicans]RAM63597.1 hypothetical protein RB24_16100 [Herbaspirillum rubrisubalbicans]RAN48613.1 hypothetical protein RB25_09735 [Herbaspirillum rubrisubalbicans]